MKKVESIEEVGDEDEDEFNEVIEDLFEEP